MFFLQEEKMKSFIAVDLETTGLDPSFDEIIEIGAMKVVDDKVVDSISDEGKNDTVVVIAAAIAAYLGTSVDNVRIKSIRRVTQKDSPWTERGLFALINKK